MKQETQRPHPKYLNVLDAAEEIGMSYNFMISRINDGTIPVIRFGRRIKIKRKDLDAYQELMSIGYKKQKQS